MRQRFGNFRRATSTVLAAVMISAYLPFSALAPAAAAPASSTKAAYKSFQAAGPVGMRKAPDASPSKVNVQWRPGVPKSQIIAAGERMGFTVVGTSKLGWVQLAPAKRMTAGALATTLRASGLTAQARPAVTYQAAGAPTTLPNDPLFPGQYGLNNTGQTGGSAGADINVAPIWNSTTGSKNIIVAVVDEGVNISHEDLKRNIWLNTDEIPNNGEDDDKNGYVDDIRGYDFYNDDETVFDVEDGDRHGTHVAGIIGAQGNNGIGVAGVNWNVSIMPIKFLGPEGGDDFAGAEAITYAVDNGAKVINCSWGGGGDSPIIEEAIEYANDHGVLIAAAAGNDAMNADGYAFWPAASDSPNVISVAATDDNDQLAEFSNFGERTVDIAAPGVDVTSTIPVEPAGIFVDYLQGSVSYKVMYLPIQVEAMVPATTRDAMIERSVKRLGAVADTEILVVDDSAAVRTSETQGTRLDIYVDALADAGFTDVSTWVTDAKGTPTQAAMQGKVVVWFTGMDAYGWYDEYCIDPSEQTAISTYLDKGGRLFMASGEMATDLEFWGGQYPQDEEGIDWEMFDEPFFQKYFHAEFADWTTWTLAFNGKSGTPFSGLEGAIPDTFNTDEFLWPTGCDAIVPLYDMPYPPGEEPFPGEGEFPFYLDAIDETFTPEPELVTRESVHTQVQVGKYGSLSGTSMAAPMVSGALALLMSELPTAPASEIAARVLNTTDPLPSLKDKTVFGGRLNVAAALTKYPGRPTITGPSAKRTLIAGLDTTLTWAPAPGGDPDATFEAEIGLPYTAWTEDFEDGTLGDFSTLDTMTPWAVSSDAVDVRSGVNGAKSGVVGPGVDVGDGWTMGSGSAMIATVTAPPGGATLSFSWRGKVGWDQYASCYIDGGMDGDWMWESIDWTEKSFELSGGEHTVIFIYENFAMAATTPDLHMSVDDLKLTAHDFEPMGTAPAGSTALTFTVPTTETADAWFRLRANNGVNSAWAYSRGHRISTDGVAPDSPADFSATAMGDGVVDFAWANPTDADFAATRVLWREGMMPTGPEDASATVTYEGTGTVSSATGLKDGTTLYAAAYAMDASGNYSVAATDSAAVVDVTGPRAVKFLEARMIAGGVGVSWMSPEASTYATITVTRRTDATPTVGDPKGTVVFAGRGSAASDWKLLETDEDAYYTVYATDASGNHSTPASVHIATDFVAPEGMIFLNDGDEFTRNPLVEVTSFVEGATEMRLFTNGEYDSETAWTPFVENTTVELLALDGWQSVMGEYRDAAGNYFSTESEIYVDRTAPSKPSTLTAENWNTGVRLSWADPVDESIVAYRVWRATGATGPWTELTTPAGGEAYDNTFYVGGLKTGVKYWFKISAVDGVGYEGPQSDTASSTVGTGVMRRAGKTRYETAAIASATHFTKADTVVLVSGASSADALCVAPLAGAVNGPVLLTGKDSLDSYAGREITRLGAKKVIVVGGTASVSNRVMDQLEDRGMSVSRIGGSSRYETAGNVSLKVLELTAETEEGWDGRVIVASGDSVADALAISPLAYAARTPILLVNAKSVPAATQEALDAIDEEYGPIDTALVAGGARTIPDAIASRVSTSFRRLGGATRYDTAAIIAQFGVDEGYLDWSRVGIASGSAFADGLAAGPALGAVGGVLLLTPGDKLHVATRRALQENSFEIGQAEIFGGSGVISSNVASQVRAAIEPPSESEF